MLQHISVGGVDSLSNASKVPHYGTRGLQLPLFVLFECWVLSVYYCINALRIALAIYRIEIELAS